jgi:histidinol-phosphate aminotransferase
MMSRFIQSHIREMAGYVPGEQPRDGECVKLNTNENPYPPSPRVFAAIRDALTADRLRKYPDPLGWQFRETAAKVLGVTPEHILIGNGSDEILTMLTRAFVPAGGLVVFPAPSYVLYATLAEIQGARYKIVPFKSNWDWERIPQEANLTFLANPNSPSGTVILPERLRDLRGGPMVVDEAYVEFADTNALELVKSIAPVIITRSLSKSYSLAGIRFGFAVADPELIRHLYKIKDSYNCDVLSLAAAAAAMEDQEHMLANRARIIATRQRMTVELSRLGFDVVPSQANFVWCRRHDRPVRPIYEELRRRRILVRYMNYEGYGDGLRISVGTDDEVDRLLGEITRALVS